MPKTDEHEKETRQLGEAVIRRVYDNFCRYAAASTLFDCGSEESDYSALTSGEIIDKIKDFLAQNPSDVSEMIFLNYLAKYPVSMCRRDVSPTLRRLIGFHYRLGEPDKTQRENGAEKVSYDDLAQIFVRSKATISACVNQTEPDWRDFQRHAAEAEEIEKLARQQLIEEEKRKLRLERENIQEKK
jgi:hypothetical protein